MRLCASSLHLFSLVFFSCGIAVFASDDGWGDDGNGKHFVELQFAGGISDGEVPMYLCVDPIYASYDGGNGGNGGSESHQKMVYTYVNGKRTECMTEYEFISRFRSCASVPRPPAPGDAALQQTAGPNYAGKDFSEQDMYGIDLQFADLQRTTFLRCDMRGAKLRAANCRGASFEGALVKGADFSGADLSDANLKGAYFVDTDLSGAKGLTLENLRMVNCLYRCKLDRELFELFVQYCSSKMRDISWNWGLEEAKRRGLD
jgi:hypothetical protein